MKIENIVIVGGGSSGWMTATTLLSCYPNLNITLVESPDIATVGVGESTIGSFNNWKYLSGIKDDSFMPHCDATYKLSIAFENWWHKDDNFRFFYPFTNSRNDQLDERNTRLWELKKAAYPDTPWTDYALCCSPTMALVNNNRIGESEIGLPDWDLGYTAAYHFDATKLALWLKEYHCLPNGLTHRLGNVMDAKVGEDGIEFLILDDNEQLTADLYIDCTGFRSILLDMVMGIPFNSLRDIIPNDYAWATKIPYENPEEQITTYTNNTAIDNGWVWEIPLQHRMGSGYVYSSSFISHDNALLEFQAHLKSKGYKDVEKLDYKHIKMRVGHHEKFFHKNVVGVGLSAAFIEPLESNGLMTVHLLLQYLVNAMDRNDGTIHITETDRKNFNEQTLLEFMGFADFVAMHYAWSHRDDTDYWKSVSNNPNSPEDIYEKASSRDFIRGAGGRYIRKGFGYCDVTPHGFKLRDIDSPEEILKCSDEEGLQFREAIESLNKDKYIWDSIAKTQPNPYQFLKQKGLLRNETD